MAFETRNPAARAWEDWNEAPSQRDTPVGALRESVVTEPPNQSGVVTMHCYNEFLDDGVIVEVDQQLQFRSFEQVCRDLSSVSLRVVDVWSDWRRTPFNGCEARPLIVFEAAKGPTNWI